MGKKVSVGLTVKGQRSCGSCTKCCEGWLTADINGQAMYPGKPCYLVELGKGCSDYENRPDSPCKSFECMWRADDRLPEEFSPLNTGNIVTVQNISGIEYFSLTFAGEEVKTDFLSWFVSFVVGHQQNAEWLVNGKRHMMGTPDFIRAMTIRDNTSN